MAEETKDPEQRLREILGKRHEDERKLFEEALAQAKAQAAKDTSQTPQGDAQVDEVDQTKVEETINEAAAAAQAAGANLAAEAETVAEATTETNSAEAVEETTAA